MNNTIGYAEKLVALSVKNVFFLFYIVKKI